MTTLTALDKERARIESVYAAAAEAWRQAQADYTAAIEAITAQRQPLLTARITALEAELRALEVERTHGQAFRCPHCGFASPLKAGLSNHIRKMHPDLFQPTKTSRMSAQQRRDRAVAEAASRYEAVSQADIATPAWSCTVCGENTYAESVSHPGICMHCAETRNGVEVAA